MIQADDHLTLLLSLSDVDLKKAAKSFAQKYSCGSSLTGPDEIVIQGDVLDDLLEFIPEKWPEVQYSQTKKQTNKPLCRHKKRHKQ